MALDVEKLLADLSAEEPCGPDLQYDPEYYALIEAAKGKAPREELAGQAVEGEEPNWKEVKASCLALFSRTRDLQVGVLLLSAATATEGLIGLRDGLAILKGLLEDHWDNVHPQLDPDDDNDPLERVNIIAGLAVVPGSEWSPAIPQRLLRAAPLAVSRQLGSFSLRDILVATGEVQASGAAAAPDMALIDGAFSDSDPDQLAAIGAAAAEAVTLSKQIDEWLTAKVGSGSAPNLRAWHDALKAVDSRLRDQLSKRGLSDGDADESDAGESAVDGSATSGGGSASGGPKLSGTIRSRDDVLTALNKILDYYTRTEPSSPVPILIRRAQRIVPMGFAEVVRELAPDAMNQIIHIAGEDPFASGSAVTGLGAVGSPAVGGGGSAGKPASAGGDFGDPVKLT